VLTASALLDNSDPRISGLADDDTPVQSKAWTWGAAREQMAYRHVIDQNPNGVPTGAYSAVTTAAQAGGDGRYYLHVQARDEAANESAVLTVHALLDNTAPVVTGLSDDPGPLQAKSWTWEGTDADSALVYRYLIDQSPAGVPGGDYGAVTTAAKAAVNGTWYLHVQARDRAGNESAGRTVFVLFDNTAPVVTDVTSTAPNGIYGSGAVIPVTVTFSEPVTVSGTPQLTLETGALDAVVNYSSGSGTAALVFLYTVTAGHRSADLDYVGTGALALNRGAVRDAVDNPADLTLPLPGAPHSLAANRAIVVRTTYTVTFHSGAHGSLAGGTPDVVATVAHGESAPAAPGVTPTADWAFAGWLPALPATITANVETTASYTQQAGAVTCTILPEAIRALGAQWRLTSGPDTGWKNSGDTVSGLPLLGNLYTVTFSSVACWISPATAAVSVPAGGTSVVPGMFRPANPVVPNGSFLARVMATDTPAQRLWDLTGPYSTTAKSNSLTLNLIHDTTGRISGTATYTIAPNTPVTMPIKGSVKGTRGSITMKGTLKGTNAAKLVRVSLTLDLTVDTANRQLVGRLIGTIRENGAPTSVNEDLTLAIPGDMDGTWALSFDLDQSGRSVTGTAELTLSNDVKHTFVVRGKTGANSTAVLTLSGSPSDPASKPIAIKTTITPLEGGWARIESFSGRGYGQAVGW
jgi:hypothetical protein